MAILGFSNVFLCREYTSVSLRTSLKKLSVNSGVQQTFSVLYWLSKKKGYAFARQRTLAEMQGINSRTVSNHIRILKKLGFIEVVRRGAGQTAKYFVKPLRELKKIILTLVQKALNEPRKIAEDSYLKASSNYRLCNKGLPLTPSQDLSEKGEALHALLEKYPNKKDLHKASRPFFRLQKEKRLPTPEIFSILIEKYQRLCRLRGVSMPELWRWLRYGWFETVERELSREEMRLKREQKKSVREQEREDAWIKENEAFQIWLQNQSSFSLESLKQKKAEQSHPAIPFEMWLRYEVFPNSKREAVKNGPAFQENTRGDSKEA